MASYTMALRLNFDYEIIPLLQIHYLLNNFIHDAMTIICLTMS